MFLCPKAGGPGDCLKLHRACTGHNKRGDPCGRNPREGADVCPTHGGNTPQVIAKANERVLQRKALKQLPADVEPMANPLRSLLQTATRAELFMLAVEQLVVDLRGKSGNLIRYRDAKGAEQLRSEIAVYERALDRVAKITESIVRLGIDEHLARVEARAVELRGEHMDDLIRRLLTALGHDPDDPATAQLVVDEIDRMWGEPP